MAGSVLHLAALVALAVADNSCDAPLPPPPQAAHGSSLLQRHQAGTTVFGPPVESASPGAALLESGCTNTPDWENWLGRSCETYEGEYCRDGAALPDMGWAFGEKFGYPENNCCACGKGKEKTCSTHPCPYGFEANADKASSTTVSDENCCRATCAGFVYQTGCPSGLTPDWDKSKSTEVSESECCKPTTTTTTLPPFDGSGKAQYVRILPQTWHKSIAMRAAVLVGEDLEVVDPPEDKRTYSSVKPLNNQYKQEGSEGSPGSNYGRSMANQCCGHAWTPKASRAGEWMVIDLQKNMDVRGVVVIGKPKRGCPHADPLFVKSVKVETATTEDPTNFTPRDGGKVWDTFASRNKGTVRIAFGAADPTTAPSPHATPVLVKSGHECKSGDENMGLQASVQACADKVEARGGRFFIFGTGGKANRCWMEKTSDETCSEGWEADSYDFYKLGDAATATPTETPSSTAAPDTVTPVLVKSAHECKSGDTDMGWSASLEECADKVEARGGRFFIFGTGCKRGKCWMEKTSDETCSEGWEADSYDFYKFEAATAAPTETPSSTAAPTDEATTVEEICPAQLYTSKILCDDDTAVEEGQCCPDNGFCPSDCIGSAQKSIGSDDQATCTCEGCRKQRKLELSDEDAMLKAHNYLRCLHGRAELVWDDAVATNAQTPAEDSCDSGRLIHSDSYGMTPRAGENLAIGLSSPERAAAAWYNELMDPGYDAGMWGAEAIEEGTGHYTALIWKATGRLGCASCDSEGQGSRTRTVWACQYAGEAPNFGDEAEWEENVPQSDVLEETTESCCARIYG